MDQRLLEYYNRELGHLRSIGGEFAQEFPKIAGRLGLDAFECADPYVERLLEGFAFLAARVQLKIDAEFPRFTQQLFETVYPNYLSPTPSMAVVHFQPDLTEGALGEGPEIPRGSRLRSMLGKGEQTRCLYTTAHPVRLWPLEVVEAAYHTRDLSLLSLPETPGARVARAAIRIRLRATAGLKMNELPLDELVLHLRAPEGSDAAMRIYEQLLTHVTGAVLHGTGRPPAWHVPLGDDPVRQLGFEEDEALLPCGPREFHGYRLLQEYFAFPDRFMFVGIRGLQEGLRQCEEDEVDLTLLLTEADIDLERVLSADNVVLHCTPAINLFERPLDRVHLSDRFPEFHVVPDRTAPLDYEVHSIRSVTGFGARGQTEEQPFESFYTAKDTDETGCYYAIHRLPRVLSERERQGRRRSSSYAGGETFITLVDINQAPYPSELRQLAVTARLTNRDLPLVMPVGQGATDFTLDSGAPVQSIRCVAGPTPPRPSHAEGKFAWRLVSHLTPNYLSLADTEKGDAAAAMRELLELYGETALPEIKKQVRGVESVSSRPIVRRVGGTGPAAFARGLEITVRLDQSAFEGTGIFLLGAVLDRFLARYVTMNVFTETVIRSAQRGEVKRWPARIGRLDNL